MNDKKYIQFDSEKNTITDPQPLPARFINDQGKRVLGLRGMSNEALLENGWAPVEYAEITDTDTQVWGFTPIWNEESQEFIFPIETVESWATYKRGSAPVSLFINERKLWQFSPVNGVMKFSFPDTESRKFLHDKLIEAGAVKVQ